MITTEAMMIIHMLIHISDNHTNDNNNNDTQQ